MLTLNMVGTGLATALIPLTLACTFQHLIVKSLCFSGFLTTNVAK